MGVLKAIFGKIRIIIIALAVLGLSGCVHPIYQATNNPVPQSDPPLSLEEVRRAIKQAAVSRNWQIEDIGLGEVRAIYAPRRHRAEVIISFGTAVYSIQYHSSQNLKYDGVSIHRNYNRWVRNLQLDIQKFLRRAVVDRDGTTPSQVPASGQSS